MTKAKDLIAGVFVLVSLLLFLVFLGWASEIHALFSDRREVRIRLRHSVPLASGAAVRYEGLQVGQVSNIRIRTRAERAEADPGYHVEMTLAIDPEVPLSKTSDVRVTGDGLLGARYVQLRGDPDGEPLADGEPILATLGGIDSFLVRMDSLTHSLDQMLTRLAALVDPEGGAQSLPQLIAELSKLSNGVDELLLGLSKTLGSVESGFGEAQGTLRDIRTLVSDANAPIRRAFERLETLPAQIEATLAEYRELAAEGRGRVVTLGDRGAGAIEALRTTLTEVSAEARRTLQHLDDMIVRNDRNVFLMLHNLRVAAEEAKLAAARLRADPSQLLFGGAEDPAAAEAEAQRSQERDLLERGFLPPRLRR